MSPYPLLAAVQGGGYVSVWKSAVVLVVLLAWTRLLTWADKDADAAHLPRVAVNVAMLAGLIAAYAAFFLLPMNFWICAGILIAVFGVEIGVYLGLRHRNVGLHDLGQQFDAWIKGFTKKKEKKDLPNQVTVVQKGGQPLLPPDSDSPLRPAFIAIQEGLTEPLTKGAEQIDFAPAESGLGVRYSVDGVYYRGQTIDRAVGADAVTMLKEAGGLDVENRRKPQRGSIRLAFGGKRRDYQMDTAGTTAGESLSLLADPKKRHDFRVDSLGFTPRQLEQVKNAVKERKGIVLVATPRGQGLTSALYGIIQTHDAFLEHIHTIEREPDTELTGITQNKLAKNATPAEEAKQVDWVISQEPDVIVVTQIEDSRSAQHLIDHARAGRMAYIGLRAGTGAEALNQWRRLVGDDRAAMEQLTMVIAGRVLRKLCVACKQPYAPDPATLKKLGMNPEKVTQLYQARDQPLRDQKGNPIPCEFCQDLHFKGRRGVFEVLPLDEDARQALLTAGSSESQLRGVYRKQKARFLQEEALGLVEEGETSVQEVLRALKGKATEEPAPAAPAARPVARTK